MARACGCIIAMDRLAGECPAPAATATLKLEFEPAPLLAALDKVMTLVTDNAAEVAAQEQVCDRGYPVWVYQ